jgi:CBS domain-containing protein
MRASEIMTFGAATIGPDAPVREAARVMLAHRISGLPVIDPAGNLVGIVSENDLLGAIVEPEAQSEPHGTVQSAQLHVRDVMTERVVTIAADTPVREIVKLMRRHAVKRLPVVSQDQVIGIVSRADLLRGLAREAELMPGASDADYALRDRIVTALEREPKTGWTSVNVFIVQGVVELRGAVTNEATRERFVDVAKQAAGNRPLEDHLVIVGPASGRL